MTELIVTIDLDWACEAAIEQTLDFFYKQEIKPTIFSTHNSQAIESVINYLEVGLHPYFAQDSSHGSIITEVVKHIMDLPHNIPAYRCHRFANCNLSNQAMADVGMKISSNVCTDLEIIPSFKNRFGLVELPIFMEDGGYLWRNHPLEISEELKNKIKNRNTKTILIHPMHFAINTPNFKYMYDIKRSVNRSEWNNLTAEKLKQLSWKNRGIRDVIIDVIKLGTKFSGLNELLASHQKSIITV